MPLDTSKQASMYVKVIQTINYTGIMPGQTCNMESLQSLIADQSIDVSIVEAPKPSNR
jgi:hypothetical protein